MPASPASSTSARAPLGRPRASSACEVRELGGAADERVAADRGRAAAPASGAPRSAPAAPGARGRGAPAAAARRAARRSCTAIAAGPGVVPSSSRSSSRSSSNARSASAGLPAASWTSISSRCADSRNGAAAIAARAACSAAPSSRPPWRSPASASASSARRRDRLQLAPLLGRPAALGVGQERLQVGRERVARALRAAARVVARLERRLRRRRSRPPTPSTSTRRRPSRSSRSSPRPVSDALAERAAQLGQQRAQRGVGGGGRALRPQDVDQLVARAAAVAVQHEIGEQQAALPPGQPARPGDGPPSTTTGPQSRMSQPSTHAQAWTLSRRQGFSKVSATREAHHSSAAARNGPLRTPPCDKDVDPHSGEPAMARRLSRPCTGIV